MNFKSLSKEIHEQIEADLKKSSSDIKAIRRKEIKNIRLWRPDFVRDTETILHSPYYNRYADKTQVFSLYKNDDISRRALHVQLVSRIARNIGVLLGLDINLIEAIALGHDMGHTPFGHAGESLLNDLYHGNTGRYFCHNAHSVRVLDGIFHHNLSLQTLDGMLCHNGELELKEYRPSALSGFEEFDAKLEGCYTKKDYSQTLIPSTKEACVVRISDIIAYIGKDRQDAMRANLIPSENIFDGGEIGTINAEMTNNLVVSIVENSYKKDYISMDAESFESLKKAKRDNYKIIYGATEVSHLKENILQPMFKMIYDKLLDDLIGEDYSSPVYKHHMDFVKSRGRHYNTEGYFDTEANQIVVDYIASMTDDYFVDLFEYLFPDSKIKIQYKSYFDDLKKNSRD